MKSITKLNVTHRFKDVLVSAQQLGCHITLADCAADPPTIGSNSTNSPSMHVWTSIATGQKLLDLDISVNNFVSC